MHVNIIYIHHTTKFSFKSMALDRITRGAVLFVAAVGAIGCAVAHECGRHALLVGAAEGIGAAVAWKRS